MKPLLAVGDTKFSHTRGFYDTNFSLSITCATPGVTIRFTTNGSAPTASSGFIYTNALPITNTTVLRAAAFKTGALPSDVDTHSYVFARDVVRQPDDLVGQECVGRGDDSPAPGLGGKTTGDLGAAGVEHLAQHCGGLALDMLVGQRGEPVGDGATIDDQAPVSNQFKARRLAHQSPPARRFSA